MTTCEDRNRRVLPYSQHFNRIFFGGKRVELIWFTVPRHTRSESGPTGNETSQKQWYHFRKFGGEIYYIFHEGMTPTLPVTIYRDHTNIIETMFPHNIRFSPFVRDCGLIKSPCTGLKRSSRFSAPVHTLEIRTWKCDPEPLQVSMPIISLGCIFCVCSCMREQERLLGHKQLHFSHWEGVNTPISRPLRIWSQITVGNEGWSLFTALGQFCLHFIKDK